MLDWNLLGISKCTIIQNAQNIKIYIRQIRMHNAFLYIRKNMMNLYKNPQSDNNLLLTEEQL